MSNAELPNIFFARSVSEKHEIKSFVTLWEINDLGHISACETRSACVLVCGGRRQGFTHFY